MKITIISSENPYPPIHGGRIDIWNRLRFLSSLGFKIQLIYWDNLQAINSELKNYVLNYRIIKKNKYNLLPYLFYPFGVATHVPCKDEVEKVLEEISIYNPDLVLFEGIYSYPLLKSVKKQFPQKLLFYRSQNIEFKHMFDQVKSSDKVVIKLRYFVDSIRMFYCERKMRITCDKVLDITKEDNEFWKNKNSIHLPPILDVDFTDNSNERNEPTDIDILFAGNLNNQNNLGGLFWFIKNVLPLLKRNNYSVVFAGSNPSKELIEKIKNEPIKLIANPISMDLSYNRSKILINTNRNVNGINIKMINMLATGKKIVSTKSATRGIPLELKKQILIGDNEVQFAELINISLNNYDDKINQTQIELTKKYFTDNSIQQLKKIFIERS